MNIVEGINGVDVHTDVSDLSMYKNQSVDVIYASHVLEHVSYRNQALPTLNEWHRVLRPGGVIMISVPDLEILSMLYLNSQLDREQQFMVMRMMFGGQIDDYDYHKGGYNEYLLRDLLIQTKFCKIHRVEDFKIFSDTSIMTFADKSISLNLIARKCTANQKYLEPIYLPGREEGSRIQIK